MTNSLRKYSLPSSTIEVVSPAAKVWLHWIPSTPPERHRVRTICTTLTTEITATQPRIMALNILPRPHIPTNNLRMFIIPHGHQVPIHKLPLIIPLRILLVLGCLAELLSSMFRAPMITHSSLKTRSMGLDTRSFNYLVELFFFCHLRAEHGSPTSLRARFWIVRMSCCDSG